jgi:hypothetical protein
MCILFVGLYCVCFVSAVVVVEFCSWLVRIRLSTVYSPHSEAGGKEQQQQQQREMCRFYKTISLGGQLLRKST